MKNSVFISISNVGIVCSWKKFYFLQPFLNSFFTALENTNALKVLTIT